MPRRSMLRSSSRSRSKSMRVRSTFVPTVAERLARKVNRLNEVVKADLHMMNQQADLSTLTQSGTITYLSTIANGDDNADRTGAAIKPHSMKVQIMNNYAAAGGTGICRYIIFQDKQCYGAAPAVADVLQTADPMSQYNVPNRLAKRFRILMDWTFSGLNATDTQYHKKIKFIKPSRINFTGVGNTVASAGINGLFLLRITTTASGTAPSDVFRYQIKFSP